MLRHIKTKTDQQLSFWLTLLEYTTSKQSTDERHSTPIYSDPIGWQNKHTCCTMKNSAWRWECFPMSVNLPLKHISRSSSLSKSPHRYEKHAIWDYTVLPATGSGDFPTFTPAKAGTQFSDPRGMQSWVELGGGYIPRYLTREIWSPTGNVMAGNWTHDRKSQVQHPNHSTNKPRN